MKNADFITITWRDDLFPSVWHAGVFDRKERRMSMSCSCRHRTRDAAKNCADRMFRRAVYRLRDNLRTTTRPVTERAEGGAK